jgi:hypothetical protein
MRSGSGTVYREEKGGGRGEDAIDEGTSEVGECGGGGIYDSLSVPESIEWGGSAVVGEPG